MQAAQIRFLLRVASLVVIVFLFPYMHFCVNSEHLLVYGVLENHKYKDNIIIIIIITATTTTTVVVAVVGLGLFIL